MTHEIDVEPGDFADIFELRADSFVYVCRGARPEVGDGVTFAELESWDDTVHPSRTGRRVTAEVTQLLDYVGLAASSVAFQFRVTGRQHS